MGLPGAPNKHNVSTYNPINHTGTPAAADAAKAAKQAAGSGSRYAGASAAVSNLSGSACMPKEGAAGTDFKASTRPDSQLTLPARVDHLRGTACIAASSRALQHGGSYDGSSSGGSSFNDISKHTAHKAKLLTLRAAVDHLAGEGCTVRQVDVVATLDAPLPTVSRGMATRLVRDRQIARTAHEHNMSSVLYQPGQGYTKVLSGGQHSDKPQQPGRD